MMPLSWLSRINLITQHLMHYPIANTIYNLTLLIMRMRILSYSVKVNESLEFVCCVVRARCRKQRALVTAGMHRNAKPVARTDEPLRYNSVIIQVTMKVAASVLALAASATAFAPSGNVRSQTQLHETKVRPAESEKAILSLLVDRTWDVNVWRE